MKRVVLYVLIAIVFPIFGYGQQQPLMVNPDGGSRPIPDPTLLTTQAQERAIAALRELLEARFKAVDDKINLSKTEAEFQDARAVRRLDDIPALIDSKLTHLEQLENEKFKGVDQQFQGRDVALAAALLAQKTSVDEQNKANAASSAKAEGATTKQIDSILAVIAANQKANDDRQDGTKALVANQAKSLDDKMNDIRNSMSDLRTSITAITAHGAGQSDLWVYLIMGGSLLVAFAGVMLPRFTHPPQQEPQPYRYPQYYYPPAPWQQQQQPQVQVVPVVPVNVSPNGNQQR